MNEFGQHMQDAEAHYQKGNLPQADALARYLLSIGKELPLAYNLLGKVALSIEMWTNALEYFQRAVNIDSTLETARKSLVLAKKRRRSYIARSKNIAQVSKRGRELRPRYLLIKSWGNGFWSDIDHVLGQLLIAELTGRSPIVHWGANSLFSDGDCDNAFELYFDPVSQYRIGDLVSDSFQYYPPKWNAQNLLLPEINKWDGAYSRMAGLYFLNRTEEVVVSDFHTYVFDLVPWINKDSPLYGYDAENIYRYLFKKYLKLATDIEEKIEKTWSNRMEGRKILSVHVRGSDKIHESSKLLELHKCYEPIIQGIIKNHPNIMIFLLTDSTSVLKEYFEKYGDRLIFTNCFRTESNVGVHYQDHACRRNIGIEVIEDVYLASRCDYFLGLGHSNVSTTILHLKEWSPESYKLLGANLLYQPHLFLHNR